MLQNKLELDKPCVRTRWSRRVDVGRSRASAMLEAFPEHAARQQCGHLVHEQLPLCASCLSARSSASVVCVVGAARSPRPVAFKIGKIGRSVSNAMMW